MEYGVTARETHGKWKLEYEDKTEVALVDDKSCFVSINIINNNHEEVISLGGFSLFNAGPERIVCAE
jgi:hypothetical protein